MTIMGYYQPELSALFAMDGPVMDLDLLGFWEATDWVAESPAAERSTARPWNVHPLWMRDGWCWWSRAEFDALEWAQRMTL